MGFIIEKKPMPHECPMLPNISRDVNTRIINYPPGSKITCEDCGNSWVCYRMPSIAAEGNDKFTWVKQPHPLRKPTYEKAKPGFWARFFRST